MSEPKRWMLEWDEDKGCSCGQKEHPQGDFVYYSVYAEVKAGWQAASGRAISYIGQLGEQSSEIAFLKAENERLNKAGDAMEEVIWLNGCLSGMQIKERAVKVWNAAKGGKPSV